MGSECGEGTIWGRTNSCTMRRRRHNVACPGNRGSPRLGKPNLSRTPLTLPQPNPIPATFDSKTPCDPLHPRIFHMFWAGPFTDKPYMAVMSFLFTQNLGLDKPMDQHNEIIRNTCRPQFLGMDQSRSSSGCTQSQCQAGDVRAARYESLVGAILARAI